MLSWTNWFTRSEKYPRALRTAKIVTFLKFAQLLSLEDRDFLKELRIRTS
jgi:hypothetical protein